MTSNIARQRTPEERELEKKKAELSTLEFEMTQRELEVITVQAELREFEAAYLSVVGAKYAELDQIEAKIAEALAAAKPRDAKAKKEAESAKRKAEASYKATHATPQTKDGRVFKASESLKKLYREVAKRFHPDLTTDPEERKRRERYMAQANEAYAAGDEQRLKEMLSDWESSPDTVEGEGPVAELVRVIQKIAQVQTRIQKLKQEIRDILKSELYQLKAKVEKNRREGRDLLSEMADTLEKEIRAAKDAEMNIRRGSF